jgi:hypothetical protein
MVLIFTAMSHDLVVIAECFDFYILQESIVICKTINITLGTVHSISKITSRTSAIV